MIRSQRQFIRCVQFLFVTTLAFGYLIALDHAKTDAADDDVVIDQKATLQEDDEPIPQRIVIDNVNPKNAVVNVLRPGRLAILVAPDKLNGKLVFDPKFDQMIFGFDGNDRRRSWRIDEERETAINELDQICQLTESQKQKLDLAGRGDSKRLFDRIEVARQNYLDAFDQGVDLRVEVAELRSSIDKGILGPESMFAKTIQNTLTKEQLATLHDPGRLIYAEGVEIVVGLIDSEIQLRAVQWNDLKDLIRLEIPRSRIFRNGQLLNFDDLMDVFLYRVASLDESKLKPLFDAKQWKKLKSQLESYLLFETRLVKKRLIVLDSEGTSDPHDSNANGGTK